MRRAAVQAQPVELFFQFSLLGLLATGYLALATSGALDLPSIVLTGMGLLLRLAIIAGLVRFEISGKLVAAATLAYFGFYPVDVFYITREFVPATVHLICFLAVVRVLSAKTDRDFFFVKVIAFLELLAATLLSASVSFFLFLTLFLIFGVATFCCTEIRRAGRVDRQVVLGGASRAGFARRLASLTALITVGIVVMTSGLFFLLPRTARAAFRSIVSERYHLPGFSNEVTLGQIGELKQSSTALLHVRIADPYDKMQLKWRGAALSQFDGRRWYNPRGAAERIAISSGPTALVDDWQRRRPGQRISYEVRIGPVDSDALFFAGPPEFVQVDGVRAIYRGQGDSFRSGLGSTQGRSYRAISHLPHPTMPSPGAALDELTRNEYLLLPGSTDRRILALAKELAGTGSTAERARRIEGWLQKQFVYTTDLPEHEVADPLAYFLFERRQGHCEYFASAMAVMLRALSIPARVVTGFQSGTYNPMTGWHVIRASDAHSWVEAWTPEAGWTTFDPTPPDMRGTQGMGLLWSKLMLYADAADTWWRDWIVNYNLDSQIDLVSRVERNSQLLRTSSRFTTSLFTVGMAWGAAALGYAAALGALGLAVWLVAPMGVEWLRARQQASRVARGQVAASDAAVLYLRMLKALHRRGVEKPAWLTPAEFARIVPASAPEARLVEQITAAYHDLRYAGRAEAGPRLVQLVQELEGQR